ncbi:MAG: hypothetical protein UGE22_02945 [Clostridia bacterium]|nr:hypothetical protein [Clostridia bacterium]
MKVKLSYVLASSLVAIALLVGIVAYNVPKSNNENVMPPTVQGILELNINKAEYQSMMTLDADIKEANTELNSEFEKDFSFVKKDINAPKDLRDYGVNKVVMTRKDFSDKDYSIAHDYIWDYSNEAENRTIRIAFSKIGKPLRDYYLSSEEKISKIENTDVIITQYEKLYLAEFKLNDVYFDIETAGITQKELVDLLVSLIK